jgi:predicted small metal-binding protein
MPAHVPPERETSARTNWYVLDHQDDAVAVTVVDHAHTGIMTLDGSDDLVVLVLWQLGDRSRDRSADDLVGALCHVGLLIGVPLARFVLTSGQLGAVLSEVNRKGGKVTKQVRCAEVGLFPDCDGVMQGETDDEVLAESAEHGKQVHGMSDADFDPATVQQVRSAIRDV